MRTFAGVLGILFLVGGLIGGFLGAITLGVNENTDDSWTCTSRTGSSELDCSYDLDANPNAGAQLNAAGLAIVVGASALFIGGCALIGGAVAGSRTQQPAHLPPPQPQPVPAGGPPSYGGGGWQGQAAADRNDPPRT